MSSEAEKAVVRSNTEAVQSQGDFDLFEALFADDVLDHTPQPNMTPDKPGVRGLYKAMREAFPDFHAVIHWQTADGEIVTTFTTSHGTHQGTFLGVAPTGRKVHVETVDAMRVHDGKITEHVGIGLNLRIAPYQTLELLTLAVWLAPPFDNAQEFGMLRQKQDQIIILATLHC